LKKKERECILSYALRKEGRKEGRHEKEEV